MIQEKQNVNVIPAEHWENYVRALELSKLKHPQQIRCRDTQIDGNGTYLHQIMTQNNVQLPHLVLLHGFGATSLQYIRIFQHLHDYFNIHALDILGFGYSGIGEKKNNMTANQAITYFINAIQNWRQLNHIDQFHLGGHSFGGYIASNYSKNYQKRVKTLSLFSPVGFSGDTYNENRSWWQSIVHCIPQKIYNIKFQPSTQLGSKFIGSIARSTVLRKLRITQQESQIWNAYYQNISQKSESSQQLFYIIFKWPIVPENTIVQLFHDGDFDFPIQVFFGSDDWMLGHTNALQHKNQLSNLFDFQVLQGSGHEITMHKPKQLSEKILTITKMKKQ